MQDLPPTIAPHPQTAALQGRLLAGENVVATLEVDLDAQARFAQGLIALTNSRLLAFDPAAGSWAEHPLAPGQSLKLSDHGGLAFMELFDARQRLARWRFTLAGNPAAVRLVDAFDREVQRLSGHTLYLPHATSLRMGRLGYQSDAQATLAVSYNGLTGYANSLHEALTKPYPAYETVGVRNPG
eukprot:gene6617-8229_t